MARHKSVIIDPTAIVSPEAIIGAGTRIWQHCQVREGVELGEGCIIGKGVYIDAGVKLGRHVKVQNGVSIYTGVTLEEGVFCGPHCVFTNDRYPRAINPDGSLQAADDWVEVPTLVRKGASIGANAVIVCGNTIGRWAMIGAGAVVTSDVPNFALVYGNPAQLAGFVCRCGTKLEKRQPYDDAALKVSLQCSECGEKIEINTADYALWASRE